VSPSRPWCGPWGGSVLLAAVLVGGAGGVAGGGAAGLEELKHAYRRPVTIPFPAENAYTPDRERLGAMLFFDPRVSGSGAMSCASCHNPGLAWGDGLPQARGHAMQKLSRRTPTILNQAWADSFFWDGRAGSLEAQALGPISAPQEMNQDPARLVATLRKLDGYRTLFEIAYPGEGVTTATIAKAIATFERTVVSGIAPFDTWIAGDETAISEQAKRGFLLFNTKARCAVCHSGWNFTDGSFHDIGNETSDLGRAALLPRLIHMKHAFKTPTLRNVDRRAPYMHNGTLATLRDVVELYDRGGIDRPSRSPEIRPLGLTTEEKDAVLTFLRTLTSPDPPVTVPELPR
jgi:cytochrome c peroxidase